MNKAIETLTNDMKPKLSKGFTSTLASASGGWKSVAEAATEAASAVSSATQAAQRSNPSRWSMLLAIFTIAASVFVSSCSTPMKHEFQESGRASWYGRAFHGRKTANGEVFNMHDYTAAHPTLAFGTRVQVRSMRTGKSVVVRINDRGPYAGKRIIDLSYAAARKLGMVTAGEDEVVINQIAAK